MKFILALQIFFHCLLIAQAANILFLVPFPGRSQWIFISKFVNELLNRGHNVTAITNFSLEPSHSNYTEVLISPALDFGQFEEESYNTNDFSAFKLILGLNFVGIQTSQIGFEDKNVQKFMNQKDLQFDLIVIELFTHESWLMFGHKFKAPIVGINTFGGLEHYDSSMGLLTPLSHVTGGFISYTDQMTFSQRVYNVIVSTYQWYKRKFYFLPIHEELAQKYFSEYSPLPSVVDLEKSISLILINSHPSIFPIRPRMPGMIDIFGAGSTILKPLPNDIQKFIDEAEDGVIYFSFGTFAKGANMPPAVMEKFISTNPQHLNNDLVNQITIFSDVFKNIKQKVLWKWENENVPNLPPNVMIRKWMPQSDILRHENVRLFISHGGLFSTTEALQRGVPTLFIPLFGDQLRNAERAVIKEYAEMIRINDITNTNLAEKINLLLNDLKYTKKAKELSELINDYPIHPMNESIYWIEYVIRHKGAKHLKSSAANMPLFNYLLLDVIGVIFISLLVFVIGIIFIVKRMLKRVFGQLNGESKNEKTIVKKLKKKN